MDKRVIDLTLDNAVAHRLLTNRDWRVRVVEEASVSSELWCTRKRSLQVGFLLAELEDLLPEGWAPGDLVTLNLPIGSLPKGAVTGFDVTAPGSEPAFLLPRRDIADIQLDFLARLAEAADIEIGPLLMEALRAAVGFESSVLARYLPFSENDDDYEFRGTFLQEYLPFDLSIEQLAAWRGVTRSVGLVLFQRSGEAPRADSAIDDLLMIIPELVEKGVIVDPNQVDELLLDWWRFIDEAVRVSAAPSDSGAAANDLLLVAADYGRRWDVVVRCTVPLNSPFTAHLEWRRGLKVSGKWRRYASQWIVFSDAKSNHFRLSSTDVNVTLGDVAVDDVRGVATLDTQNARKRSNREYFALYSSDPQRDYLVNIVFELRLPAATQALLVALSAFLFACIVALVGESPGQPTQVTALIAPGTIAASVVLAREQSTLAAALRRRLTHLLVGLLAVLWTVAIVLLAAANWNAPGT